MVVMKDIEDLYNLAKSDAKHFKTPSFKDRGSLICTLEDTEEAESLTQMKSMFCVFFQKLEFFHSSIINLYNSCALYSYKFPYQNSRYYIQGIKCVLKVQLISTSGLGVGSWAPWETRLHQRDALL